MQNDITGYSKPNSTDPSKLEQAITLLEKVNTQIKPIKLLL